MICPDCGQEFDPIMDQMDFDRASYDPTVSYASLPYKMCCECAMRYLDALFPSLDEMDEYDEIYK